MTLKQILDAATARNLPGIHLFRPEFNAAKGRTEYTVRAALPMTVVSIRALAWRSDSSADRLSCRRLFPAAMRHRQARHEGGGGGGLRVPLLPKRRLTSLAPRTAAQDAAYEAYLQVKTYPAAAKECAYGGLQARPPLMAGAGLPTLEAIPVPL